MNTPKSKDRNLSPIDYLDALQKEYFTSKLRHDIHHNKNNKEYHKRVMGHKKEKIESIAFKNAIPNIFSDQAIWSEYRDKVYLLTGVPTVLTEEEVMLYYSPNQDVKVELELDSSKKSPVIKTQNAIGKIESCSSDLSVIYVKLKGDSTARPFAQRYVTRIF